jgi:protein phosphatase
MQLSAAFVCDKGLSAKRPINEDRALALIEHGLFVVCDGVGGHNSGEVASQLAVDTIEEAVADCDSEDMVQLLERAVQYANRDIYEMAMSRTEYEGMATTIALLHIDGPSRRAVIGHAGDSRVYRFDGVRLHRETYDHTDIDDAVRAGILTPERAVALGKQNVINRALGIEPNVRAEFKTIPFEEGEAFFLCSDGVTRHVDDEELESLLAEGLPPEQLCEKVKARCYAGGAEDNLTAIAVYTAEPRRMARSSRRERAERRESGDRFEVAFGTRDRTRQVSGENRARLARGWWLALLGILLAVGGFFAGRVSVSWTAPPAQPGPSERQPSSSPSPLATGREAFERGDLAASQAAFQLLATREPDRADYQYWLGRTAARQNQTAQAIRYFERAIELDGTLTDAYVYLAATYQQAGKPDQAAQTLRRYAETTKKVASGQ